MKISIGADHGGYKLREHLVDALASNQHDVIDHGAKDNQSVDYPDYAKLVSQDVVSGKADRGILICTSGIGMSITANKVRGIRAALVNFEEDAIICRQHNDANILVLSGKHTNAESAANMAKLFLDTPFEGGRHARRVDKMES